MTPAVPSNLGGRVHGVSLSSGRHRWLEWGSTDARAMVLLHGRTSVVETWVDVASAFASDGWHIYALEQRGHGESAWDSDGAYQLDDFLGDYEEFVAKVVRQPHVLIGHSMGSCTSLVYASRHPDMVHALVLEDGGPLGPTVTQAVDDDLASSPPFFATWADARAHVARTHPHLDEARVDLRTDQTVRPGIEGRYYWRSDVRSLLGRNHLVDEQMDRGLWRAVDELEVDTIFLWASSPYLVEPEVVDEMVARNPRIAKIVFPTGHSIHEERIDLFWETVAPFLFAQRRTAR